MLPAELLQLSPFPRRDLPSDTNTRSFSAAVCSLKTTPGHLKLIPLRCISPDDYMASPTEAVKRRGSCKKGKTVPLNNAALNVAFVRMCQKTTGSSSLQDITALVVALVARKLQPVPANAPSTSATSSLRAATSPAESGFWSQSWAGCGDRAAGNRQQPSPEGGEARLDPFMTR